MKMKKVKFWLKSILLLQLVISLAILWGSHLESLSHKPTQLLNLDWTNIDKFTVEDKIGGITLVKKGKSWSLSNQQLPVSINAINKFLNSLISLETGWPIATTSTSHERFKVSESKFVRRVELFANNISVGKLLFGSSIGLRQSNVRSTTDDNIYNAKLDTLDVSANIEDWFDKSLIAASDINKIEGKNYSLRRIGATWEFDRSGPSILMGQRSLGMLDQNKAAELDNIFTTLRILKISSYKSNSESDASENFQIKIDDDRGSWTYTFAKVGTKFYVNRDDREEYFTLNQDIYEKVSSVTQSALIYKKPANDQL